MPRLFNVPAANVSYFIPSQYPPAGTALESQPDGKPVPTLFQPIKIRGVECPNRLWLSPMGQNSSHNGVISPWQFVHIGAIVSHGPGLSIVEATAVSPEGRTSPDDAGIWTDEQGAAWSKLVEFAHSQNQKIGIQLAHAGRKASTVALAIRSSSGEGADEIAGGWPDDVVAPSAIQYSPGFFTPKELTKAGITRLVKAFVDAATRAVRAGFDVIEIHGAHGYLIHSFLSPVSNKRTDEYGGSFENRIRFAIELVDAVRAAIPPTMPLFFRVSATDWLEEVFPNEPSWRSEDTVRLAGILADHGVDLLDVSTGGISPAQRIKTGPAYQVPLAEQVKTTLGNKILVAAVGKIHEAKLAQSVLDEGKADVIFNGRTFLKNPALVWSFADELGVKLYHPRQFEWAFVGRGKRSGKRE